MSHEDLNEKILDVLKSQYLQLSNYEHCRAAIREHQLGDEALHAYEIMLTKRFSGQMVYKEYHYPDPSDYKNPEITRHEISWKIDIKARTLELKIGNKSREFAIRYEHGYVFRFLKTVVKTASIESLTDTFHQIADERSVL